MTRPVTRGEAQAAAKAAAAERDAIQANLLELDGSFGKRLLAGATLTGQTKRQWDSASTQLTGLWDKFTAYSAVIDRVVEILGTPGRVHPSRLAEAMSLLQGPSVEVAGQVSPLGQRELTAGAQRRLTLASAVAEMKYEFPRVAAVLTAAEAVWNEVSDGLRQATEALDEARRNAPALGDAELTNGLNQADNSLHDLRATLNGDPLTLWRNGQVDSTRLEQLKAQASAVARRSRELTRVRDDADRRIAAVHSAVATARQARQDAAAARERAAAKIALIAIRPLPDLSGLDGRVERLGEFKAAGRWPRLASELDLLDQQVATVLKQCKDAEQSAAGLLGRRDELRGMLDAYRAKAASLGAAENAELQASYRQAKDLLWTAPCNLASATAAVSDYQQAVLRLQRVRSRDGERA